nr:translational initiation factor 1 [Vuralia turcica]WOZ11495.1 translational initiation factor 1 [Vuralia turcica]
MHEGVLTGIRIKEKKRQWIYGGLITELLPKGMFQIPLYYRIIL